MWENDENLLTGQVLRGRSVYDVQDFHVVMTLLYSDFQQCILRVTYQIEYLKYLPGLFGAWLDF
jgi:hypothetical protein